MTDSRPWRKVVYSEKKPNTRSRWFILLECGHCLPECDCKAKPKRRRCTQCEIPKARTVQQIFFEHEAMNRGYFRLQKIMEDLGVKDNV